VVEGQIEQFTLFLAHPRGDADVARLRERLEVSMGQPMPGSPLDGEQ
jgi:hypothetical protein